LALEGAGVAVIPSYVVDGHIERGDLMHLFPNERLPELKLQVVFASRINVAATARTFVNFMIDQLGDE
jgi:DNA-binding transcriptional LysR family regulator